MPEAPGDRARTPGSWACWRPFQFLSQPTAPKAGRELRSLCRAGGVGAGPRKPPQTAIVRGPGATSPLSGKLGLAALSLRPESRPGGEAGGWGREPAGNRAVESPPLKVPFSQSHRPDPRAKTDSQAQPLELLKTQLTGCCQGFFSEWGRAPRSCYNPPQVSWRRAILHGAPKGPKVLNQHTAHTPTPAPLPAADDPALTHTRFSFFFFLKGRMGREAAGPPAEFSLWFPGLKGGSASGLGAGRKSRGPGGVARGTGVSGA